MHQMSFGSWALPGPAGELKHSPGLCGHERDGNKGREGEERKGERGSAQPEKFSKVGTRAGSQLVSMSVSFTDCVTPDVKVM